MFIFNCSYRALSYDVTLVYIILFQMCGFPINRPYSNTEVLVNAIQSTGMHLNESPLVEFALAVYVHPYPNQVLSVWIYLASLQPRRWTHVGVLHTVRKSLAYNIMTITEKLYVIYWLLKFRNQSMKYEATSASPPPWARSPTSGVRGSTL